MNDSDFSSLGLQNGDLVFVKYERDHGRSGKISYCALGLFYMFQHPSSHFEVYSRSEFYPRRRVPQSEDVCVEEVVSVRKLMLVNEVREVLKMTKGLNNLSGTPSMG